MDVIMNPADGASRVAGKIADFNAQPVPEEIKKIEFNLEDISKNLDHAQGLGDSTVTSGGKDLKEVKPEVKTEVPPEKKEEKSVVAPPAPKEEKKVEQPKTEKKVEDKPKVSSVLKAPEGVEKKVETQPKQEEKKSDSTLPFKPITPIREEGKKEEDKFDYSGYSPVEQTNMKNMSRQSREAYSELIKQNRELSKLKDGLYLQHEGAFILSPEFQQLQQRGYLASNEAKAWEKSLLDIKAGKPFRPPVGINKDGSIALGDEMQPSDQLEITVSNNLLRCQQVLGQVESDVRAYPQRYQQLVNADLQAIREVQHGLFAWYGDPKLLDYKLEGGDKTIAQIRQEEKSRWPAYMQSHPAVDVLADAIVALRITQLELNEARKGQKLAEVEREEVKRGEPSSAAAPDEQLGKKNNGKNGPATFELPPESIRL